MKNTTDDFAELLARAADAQAMRTVGLDYPGSADSLRPLLDLGFDTASRVSVARCADYEDSRLREAILDVLSGLAAPARLRSALRVVVKLGLVEARPPEQHVTVQPALLGALLAVLRHLLPDDAALCAADGPGHERDTEYVLDRTGVAEVLALHGVPFVDLNQDDVRRVEVPDAVAVRELMLPATVTDADFIISLAKLKTHHRAAVTLGMKNLFGCVPGSVYGFPKTRLHYAGTARAVADLTSVLAPGLTLIDAVVGMEGTGPLDGWPRHVGAIIGGDNAATTDAVGAMMMGFAPALIPQFWYAMAKGLLDRPDVVRGGLVSLRRHFEPPSNIAWIGGSAQRSHEEQLAILERLLSSSRAAGSRPAGSRPVGAVSRSSQPPRDQRPRT